MRYFFRAIGDYITDPLFTPTTLRVKLAHLPAAVLYALKSSNRALYRTPKE